jgi:V/A-type H+-transporting ATPase subunit I
MIRPRPARWFEAIVARQDAVCALEALAGTGAIELEAAPGARSPPTVGGLDPLLARFAELERRYRSHWPAPDETTVAYADAPAAVLEAALARIGAWAADAEPRLAELQAIGEKRAELMVWAKALEAVGSAAQPPASDSDQLAARLVTFPSGGPPPAPSHTLMRPVDIAGEMHWLVLGPPSEVVSIAEAALAARGRALPMPNWLECGTGASLACIAARLPALDARAAELQASLKSLAQKHAIARALAEVHRLRWLAENMHALTSGEHFAFVTGWTSEGTAARLVAALDACGARAIVHFAPPPHGIRVPLLFENPPWIRPFEIFAKALGMPARDEVDPSVLLVFMVPLLFGYMFGDVGQGALLAIGGYALRRRFVVARLFIAGGVSAMLFGLLFGSVFGLHVLPPLWVEPLERPLDVLLVPIFGGALLLAVGLLLGGLEAHWRGALAAWLASDGQLVVAYAAIVVAFAWTPALAVAALAALGYCASRAFTARRPAAAVSALGELVERTLQLLINTLSFARVGAFALAHAGLASAIVALMDATTSTLAKLAVLVVANVLVIALETLVVSIQTTRLVLFEFFTRFLRATGRTFRPLPPPPFAHRPESA